ncbi:DNA adenine methylase [Curtobacterium flaccumfaciens]|uniref:DNA adenine methylase n=1 Tax=Curtobacterium flaccumfaciens TaxID=2035 RepID=UPI00188D3474|nr:DNA adenine methylase [Curtobacterium flaccumfaciens]MBF4593746.1 DNA adenine methylase [Curtobacterium flaccumfaciens]
MAPFLRWAGGKRWAVPIVRKLVGDFEPETYIEPFSGGCAVFFGLPMGARAALSDTNGELIATYRTVQLRPRAVADGLARLANDSETYYEQRAMNPPDELAAAVRFIYLNHTSFNGIYRVNLRGQYNVPFGSRKSMRMPDLGTLLLASSQLTRATLRVEDFEESIDRARAGDLIFADPPYSVANEGQGFVKYNEKVFSFEDQERLRKALDRAKKRSVFFVLTNADHPSIRELFGRIADPVEYERRSVVGGHLASRGRTRELFFTNLGTS